MDRQEIISELTNTIQDFLINQGLDLVDLMYRYEGRNFILRILVDRPQGGITLDECAYLNNEISRILDEKNILQERYILEVFSPGMDRPLKTKSDFLRCIDTRVRFFFKEPIIDGKTELEGLIIEVREDSVCADIEEKRIEIPLSKITKAKQVLDNI